MHLYLVDGENKLEIEIPGEPERGLLLYRAQDTFTIKHCVIPMPQPESTEELLLRIGQRSSNLKEHIDSQVNPVLDALKTITDHFADVMGGPLVQGRGVTFERGVEGIPTIKEARRVLKEHGRE